MVPGCRRATLRARKDRSTARFVVDKVARCFKNDFPTAEMYGARSCAPSPIAELRPITGCGGNPYR